MLGRNASRQEATGSREDLRQEGFREEAKGFGEEANGRKASGKRFRQKAGGSRCLCPRAAGFGHPTTVSRSMMLMMRSPFFAKWIRKSTI